MKEKLKLHKNINSYGEKFVHISIKFSQITKIFQIEINRYLIIAVKIIIFHIK